MDNKRDIFNAFFKAQDRFLLAAPHGFEPDVIHDYIHWGMVLSSCYEHDADEENLLLCELFLRQVYFHLLDAIQDSTRSRIFRRVCLDSIHTPLFCLKRYYYQFEQGDVKFLTLQQQLRLIQISLD
ncbi:TPA: hypothetical protein ACVOYR_003920 [Vibrio alginolyticus]|uniref:hypothetical protein n=1 Tax=Vibrio alginolyticus TaxID=663 RepID=UPI00215F804A|nr:hypothetical protein [Vibrio alginolyticus]EHC9868870.1 hypothetical protein [Vibrio alginolyticus]EJS0325511.1 hypothetical protein [Vibrio alginolyticus]ELB2906851.1 hypothetical protein [Vibrio alginolyticus]ELW1401453.1 hypothetical protein [Vibrio alginolyticus]MCS0224012.1 hypothetical protein [Vibrio alginolyticus]